MQFKNNIKIYKKIFSIFIMPFYLSISIVSVILYILKLVIRLSLPPNTLQIGIIFGFIYFFLYIKNLDTTSKLKNIIVEFSTRLFLTTLFFITLINFNFLKSINLPIQTNLLLTFALTFSGIITIYFHSELIRPKELKLGQIEELKVEQSKYINFDKNFTKINKIPVLRNIIRWFYTEGWFYSLSLVVITFLFLGFGLHHLGQFMSVDEPKWVDTRVPQLFEALKNKDWSSTYINDKPGILPAFLSGAVNIFLNFNEYKNNPLIFEQYLFYWRLPILLFNFLMLFLIYHFTKKLLGKNHSLLITGLISLNPILIGISQIVNPDATLWSVGFLSFINFFLYLKTNQKKYIYYSGIFLGLSLISKYFASIFYIIFFLTIYFEYLTKQTSRGEFYKRCLDALTLFATSIVVYTILFPATWVTPLQILKGTIGAQILTPGLKYFSIALFLIFFEIIILKEKLSSYIKNKINIEMLIIYIFNIIFFVTFIFLMLNITLNNLFFDFNQYLSLDFVRGIDTSIKTILASSYTTLLTTTFPALIGITLIPLATLNKRFRSKVKEYSLLITTIYISISIFFIGSFLGGYIVDTRYQILLYPLLSTLGAIYIFTIFKDKKILITLTFLSLLFTIISIQPFYFHYTNKLNIKNYVITDAWGFEGYELAQKFNTLFKDKNIIIWTDREGFNDFYVGGKTYWRGEKNPFDTTLDIDYLILTEGGKRIFTKSLKDYNEGKKYLYARVAGETKILEFYKKEPDLKVCIQKNPNNCIWAVKLTN